VTVKTQDKGAQQKTLLNNVSAEAHHGQILAVVGPSGSGKTTFLDAIAGRISRRSLQGEILVNGEPTNEYFNRISGYVMQDDALFPHLTVRETLMYSARLRIPGHLSLTEKRNRVENMILNSGLKQCADTRVGNDLVRNSSAI
jgi:ABC-type multidrug transport system ATPase subunit